MKGKSGKILKDSDVEELTISSKNFTNKIPVKVKIKVRDFEAIIYKIIENPVALWYNSHNRVCYALPA